MMYLLKKSDGSFYIDSAFAFFSEDIYDGSLLKLVRAEYLQKQLLQQANPIETTIIPVKLSTQEDIDWCDKCDPIYCRTCGGCGESGCCSPAACTEVQCLYGTSNVDEYRAMERNYDSIAKTLDSVKKALDANDIEAAKQAIIGSEQWI